MATFATQRFPDYAEQLEALLRQHREIPDETLHLAVCYDPGRDSDDIFLFEVIGHFGSDMVDPDQELFEVAYGSSDAFPMKDNQKLHLVLTNPIECREAAANNWKSMEELRGAMRRGDFEVLYRDEIGAELLEIIRNE